MSAPAAAAAAAAAPAPPGDEPDIYYRQYASEADLPLVTSLVDAELSEPYSIFTYRYFLRNWPSLCVLALDARGGASAPAAAAGPVPPPGARGGGCRHVVTTEEGHACFGVIVGKMDDHRGMMRGYIAMLVVATPYRGRGVGKQLVRRAVAAMAAAGADEAVLEAEATNAAALRAYEGLGFLRDKRLLRYYLNGADAYRLKLLLPESEGRRAERAAAAALAAVAVSGEEEGGEGAVVAA